VVLNRVHSSSLDVSADRARSLAEDLDPNESGLEIEALRRHAQLMRVIDLERRLIARFASNRPTIAETRIQALPSDVTDLESLRRVGASMAQPD